MSESQESADQGFAHGRIWSRGTSATTCITTQFDARLYLLNSRSSLSWMVSDVLRIAGGGVVAERVRRRAPFVAD